MLLFILGPNWISVLSSPPEDSMAFPFLLLCEKLQTGLPTWLMDLFLPKLIDKAQAGLRVLCSTTVTPVTKSTLECEGQIMAFNSTEF